MEQLKYSKLKGRIIEKFGSQSQFAKVIRKTEQTVTAKMKDRSMFSQEDIIEWSKALDINADEVGEYFFASKL